MYDLWYNLKAGGLDRTDALLADISASIAPILIAAFAIAVGFVAYKLIKRALNKA